MYKIVKYVPKFTARIETDGERYSSREEAEAAMGRLEEIGMGIGGAGLSVVSA